MRLGPLQGRFDAPAFFATEIESLRRGRGLASVSDDLGQEVGNAALVLQHIRGARRLVAKGDLEAFVQEGLALQPKTNGVRRKLLLTEDLVVRPEEGGGARAARRPLLDELRDGLAAGIGLFPFEAIATNAHDHLFRKGIHDRRAHAVQTARVLVLARRKLAAGVKRGQHQLERGLAEFLLGIDGNATAVVHDCRRLVILVQSHFDVRGVGVDDLVHRVVDDFPQQVVVALGIGATDVHAGPTPHGL